MKSLSDFTTAFPGWSLYDYRQNNQIDYLEQEFSGKSQEKLGKLLGYSNRHTILALQRRYKALYHTPDYFTFAQWEKCVLFYGGDDNRCLKCGEIAYLLPDHILSASLGGSNSIANIQPLCQKCNSEKRSSPIDYRPDHGEFGEILSYWEATPL